MKFLTDLLNKLFGLGGKAQLIILVISHTVALVLGLMIGIVFAKPTIIINKDNQHNEQVDDEVIWGGDKAQTGGSLQGGSSNYQEREDSEYRSQLLLQLPPSPSI